MAKEIRALFEELKRELRAEFKGFKEALERDFRNELREIKSSVASLNTDCEEVKAENVKLKATNAMLEATCADLAQKVKDHESRLLHLEQYSRNANVELKGIPYNATENLIDTVIKIGEKVGVPLEEADFESVHRVPTSNLTKKNVVVQFARRQKRDCFLENARAARLKCSDVGFDSEEPFFVNEHLCPELKRLLGQATARKRETGWKYVWVQNGKIFARRMDNAPKIKISCSGDVAKMVNPL